MSDLFTTVTMVYKDNPTNRKLGRVGKKYEKKLFKKGAKIPRGKSAKGKGLMTPYQRPGVPYQYPEEGGRVVGPSEGKKMKDVYDKFAKFAGLDKISQSKSRKSGGMSSLPFGGLSYVPFGRGTNKVDKAALSFLLKRK